MNHVHPCIVILNWFATATEALYCHPEKDIVYLKKRRGFVKLALETGSCLVPVYSFVCLTIVIVSDIS